MAEDVTPEPQLRIVRTRRDGRMVYYSLTDAHVRLLLDVSAEHLRHAELT